MREVSLFRAPTLPIRALDLGTGKAFIFVWYLTHVYVKGHCRLDSPPTVLFINCRLISSNHQIL